MDDSGIEQGCLIMATVLQSLTAAVRCQQQRYHLTLTVAGGNIQHQLQWRRWWIAMAGKMGD
jgi:hypothetical protein